MNGSHGIPVDAYVATNKAAVVLNTGATQCQMIGNENTYFGAVWACALSDIAFIVS